MAHAPLAPKYVQTMCTLCVSRNFRMRLVRAHARTCVACVCVFTTHPLHLTHTDTCSCSCSKCESGRARKSMSELGRRHALTSLRFLKLQQVRRHKRHTNYTHTHTCTRCRTRQVNTRTGRTRRFITTRTLLRRKSMFIV